MFWMCSCQDGACEDYEVLRRDAVFQNAPRHILDDVPYLYFQAQNITKNHINVIRVVVHVA